MKGSAPCFCKESVIETQSCPFVYILPMFVVTLQWQSWVVATETLRPAKTEVFTVWPFSDHCCQLLMWPITWIAFWILNQSCYPRINFTWLWYIIYFFCCWIQFANILPRTFAFLFMKDTCLLFSCLTLSLSGFSIRVMPALKWVGTCPSRCIFWKKFV